jgi:hypothetical protein
MIDEKLTRELCCVEGFQSFWACSRCAAAGRQPSSSHPSSLRSAASTQRRSASLPLTYCSTPNGQQGEEGVQRGGDVRGRGMGAALLPRRLPGLRGRRH